MNKRWNVLSRRFSIGALVVTGVIGIGVGLADMVFDIRHLISFIKDPKILC